MPWRLLFLVLILLGGLRPGPAAGAELIMFESAGCPYCARWHREIGPIYPKTDEAKRAPLRRVDIAAPRPADLAGIRDVIYTPTFVLLHEGREIGRIVGYNGDEAFWSLLSELVAKLGRQDIPKPVRKIPEPKT
jgi:thioredoxin-related protein